MSGNIENMLYTSVELDPHGLSDNETARLTIHENRVVNSNRVEGLTLDVEELIDGVKVTLKVEENVTIAKPVHLCFGVLPEEGMQRIIMNVYVGKYSKIDVFAHCSFPFAKDVTHLMDGEVFLNEGSSYGYFERHVHSEMGGIKLQPKTVIHIGENAKFKSEFELLKGRVGQMEMIYESFIQKKGVVDMNARISASGNDILKIEEIAHLEGDASKAVLTSKIAVRNNARAEISSKITAYAPDSRGHLDCKEIVKDNGIAIAIPTVDVRNHSAHVTHEAAVGSVDKKQLETLMARGLDEDSASEIIIKGLLS